MAQIKKISTELQLLDKLLDTSGDAGTSGQVLSSTGTGTNWIDAASGTVTGSGTDNYIPLWNGTTGLNDSIMFQTGTDQVKMSSAANAYFTIRTATTTGTTNLEFADSSGAAGALLYNHTSNSLAFQVNSAERMRIDSSGNVGIGTTSPSRNLQIGDGSGNSVLAIVASTTGLSQIGLGDSDDDNRMQIIADHNQELFSIQTGGGTALNGSKDRLVIKGSGEVGIGTTSPTAPLHIEAAKTAE